MVGPFALVVWVVAGVLSIILALMLAASFTSAMRHLQIEPTVPYDAISDAQFACKRLLRYSGETSMPAKQYLQPSMLTSLLGVLAALALCFLVGPGLAEAAWDAAGEKTAVEYRVLPQEGRIHVTIAYTLKNLDPETKGQDAFYYRWTVDVEKDAKNIDVHGGSKLPFTTELTGEWNLVRVELGTRLYYGVEYDFWVEYDLPISQNVVIFTGYGRENGATTLRILVPHAYYDETVFTKSGYSLALEGGNIAYVYTALTEGWRVSATLYAARKTPLVQLTGSVALQTKATTVTVKAWEGESARAQAALDVAIKGLPVLEQLIGAPLPSAYSMQVQEATYGDLKGATGINRHAQGILVGYGDMDGQTIVHELSHEWFTAPYFKEAWMWEGNAELFAYLALQRMGDVTGAGDIKTRRTSRFEQSKNTPLNLADWGYQSCATYDESSCPNIAYGYGKSFVFMYTLYQKVGVEGLQQVNRQAMTWGKPVDWFDYLEMTEAASGQDLNQAFAGWVVPASYGASLAEWQTVEKGYREAKATLASKADTLGMTSLEGELATVKSRIMAGQFASAAGQLAALQNDLAGWQAALSAYRRQESVLAAQEDALGLSVVQASLSRARTLLATGRFADSLAESKNTFDLLDQWQTALAAYRQAEAAFAQPSDTLGLASVAASLDAAKTLLTSGRYSEVAAQVSAVTTQFSQWKTALAAYRQAEAAIAQPVDALGLNAVTQSLAQAQALLTSGEYGPSSVQVAGSLTLFAQWKTGLTAYRDVEAQVAAVADTLGGDTVKTTLAQVKVFLEGGDYARAQTQSGSVAVEVLKWREALSAYRSAESKLGHPTDDLGFAPVQHALAIAGDTLVAGRFAAAVSQTDIALTTFNGWQKTLDAYRQTEAAFASATDTAGASPVEQALGRAKALLEAGSFDDAVIQTGDAEALRVQWQKALRAYRAAENAVAQANVEGRTWQLDKQEGNLAAVQSLLSAGSYESTANEAQNVVLAAQAARSPVRVFTPVAAAAGVTLLLIPVGVAFWMRRRSRRK